MALDLPPQSAINGAICGMRIVLHAPQKGRRGLESVKHLLVNPPHTG